MARFNPRDAFAVRGRISLRAIDPGDRHGVSPDKYRFSGRRHARRLGEYQERLYAEGTRSLLVVLQGLDAAGKDGTIAHVFQGMNPQGVRVHAFRRPTAEERERGFLWRIRQAMPEPRMIVIFNRSHYEDVLAARVHRLAPAGEIEARYAEINQFEAAAVEGGTTILKFCLLVSRAEQRRRLLARLDDPTKRWKFQAADLQERALWSDYGGAYEAMLNRCSTAAAPWYVIPADDKDFRNWAVSRIMIDTLRDMRPRYPDPGLDLAALRRALKSG